MVQGKKSMVLSKNDSKTAWQQEEAEDKDSNNKSEYF